MRRKGFVVAAVLGFGLHVPFAPASAQVVATTQTGTDLFRPDVTNYVVALQADQGQLMLRFQLIEATTRSAPRDPAIANVDSVLRDLFRYGGYQLITEAAVAASDQGSSTQILNGRGETYQLDVTVTGATQGRGGGRGAAPYLVQPPPGGGAARGGRGGAAGAVDTTAAATTAAGGRGGAAGGRGAAGGGTGAAAVARGSGGGGAAAAMPTMYFDVVTTPMQASAPRIYVVLRSVPPFTETASQAGSAQGVTAQTRSNAARIVLQTSVTVSIGHTVVLGSTQPGGPDRALILVMRPELRKY